ncbi:Sortase family protein [Actinacidiphila yanglinensis]|uniref:Sortase family protein n=1 Tax=Actinacidiphila yanglinensis TaxID=310779 RepID=A0A1H6D870_9ACTN|nr:class F sortase [Actinacidiphila yanglinensis]SEG81294.1 Sortase family protein [Actinacidiphila yanglinensis]
MRASRPAAVPSVVAATCLAAVLVAGCGATPAAPAPAGPPSSASPAATAAPAGSAGSAAPRPIARSVPVRLRIPAIGVDTPLMGLGLAADGTVEVPPVRAHSPAGWYRGSPAPGQLGPSVILGHVTVGRYGDGVFLHLARLRPGARVEVELQDGRSTTFTVHEVRTVAKDRFPTRQVYGNTDRPELRLITCGGPRTGSGYLDNVVVFAALSAVTPAG